ncbi:hypothetical protein FVR03_14405 [Pontibacter qinzhouensis]|uniref:Uncharacterized protein n=1 Tax=Pontibacter qinzhouensis TaxID=2603253 RepID=A0A5C8JI39_9BACT|nr:hypothetical protein [Pontibacter qinzhouensis]TXK38000.1 hypothetical protein FVR03_14405 [Pontibacter qinzhouensis]
MNIKLKLMLVLLLAVSGLQVQAQTKSQIERDLEDLRGWLSKKANQADSLTRAEWPAIKQEFFTRTEKLDKNAGKLSDNTKQEYGELKNQYRELEQQNEEAYGQPLNREEAARWERELTGTNNIKAIKMVDLRDRYIYFMEQVRARRTRWSLRDWDYAEHVYLQLSDRKELVLDALPNGDKMKIAALQVEFNTLRKSRDVKDRFENRKN